MEPISPSESRLGRPFAGFVSPNNNGPAYEIYSENPEFKKLQPFNYNYIVPILPGRKRGGKSGHYHLNKSEVYCLVTGEIDLYLADVNTNKKEWIKLSGLDPKGFSMLVLPPGIAHFLINNGSEKANLLIYSNRPVDFDDEIPYDVLG